MTFHHHKFRAILSFIVGTVFFVSLTNPAFAERDYWPYSNAECQSKTNDFERDCLWVKKFALRDMKTKQVSSGYIHKSTNLTKSELKKAVKLQRLTKDDKKKALYRSPLVEGLRSENGTVLLQTVFEHVYPMSPTHSLVMLFNQKMMIAEHGTHKLTDTNYTYWDMVHLRALDEETDLHFEHIFFVTEGGPSFSPAGKAVPLLPDTTFGEPIIYARKNDRSLVKERGNGFLISVNTKPDYRGKWLELLYDEWYQPVVDNPDRVSFAVKYGTLYKNNGSYDSTVSKVSPVGQISEGQVGDIGGLTEKMLTLYWPYDENGGLMRRPDNILGMMPIKRSGRSEKYYDAWLVVFKDGAANDYAIATFDNTSAASNVASQIDKFEVLENVYFRNAYLSNTYSYALKLKSRSGSEQPWYGYLADESPRENIFAILKGDDVRTDFQGATAKSAIDARVLDHKNAEAKFAREQAEYDAQVAKINAELEAEIARREKLQFQAEFGWQNPTTPAAQCASSYAALREEYMSNTANPYFQSKRAWMTKYEANGAVPCDMPPGTSGGGSTYTLSDGIRDMGNAAACTRQERRCVSDGQYERCSMVTVKVC